MDTIENKRSNIIKEIREKSSKIKPVVVINCITYNHEKYIKDALEGFVCQKTDFPYVALVHDDASTDATREIIQDYARRFPNIIFPIFEEENLYSKHDGSLGKIMSDARNATGAKYVALCEGDDYWTDPLKLQKQVDFLEANPGYSMCFSNALEQQDLSYGNLKQYSPVLEKDYKGTEIFEPWIIATNTVVLKKEVYHSKAYESCRKLKGLPMGDVQLFLSAATVGKIRGMADVVGVYRRTKNGASNTLRNNYIHLNSLIKISKVFGQEYINICKIKFRKFYFPAIKNFFLKRQELKFILRYTYLSPELSIQEILYWTKKIIVNKLHN